VLISLLVIKELLVLLLLLLVLPLMRTTPPEESRLEIAEVLLLIVLLIVLLIDFPPGFDGVPLLAALVAPPLLVRGLDASTVATANISTADDKSCGTRLSNGNIFRVRTTSAAVRTTNTSAGP